MSQDFLLLIFFMHHLSPIFEFFSKIRGDTVFASQGAPVSVSVSVSTSPATNKKTWSQKSRDTVPLKGVAGLWRLQVDCIVYKKTHRTSGRTKYTVIHPSQQPARPHFLINPPYNFPFADRKNKTTESWLFYLIPTLVMLQHVLYYKKNER